MLSDCFNTTAYEHQVRCNICPKSLAVQVNIKMFRNELLQHNKLKNRNNANVKNTNCLFCDARFPSCAVCFQPVSVLNSRYEFMKKQTLLNSAQQQKDLNQELD